MKPLLTILVFLAILTSGEARVSMNTITEDVPSTVSISSKDSILSDYDYFVSLVEDTHPDPYQGFGGRVFFHKEAEALRRQLLEKPSASISDLYDATSEFIACLRDGHSFVKQPASLNSHTGNDSIVLVKFLCMDGAPVVNAIDSASSELIGSRVTGVNGKPIEEFLEQVAIKFPCENRYGELAVFCNWFRPLAFYRNILRIPADAVTLEMVTPAGKNIDYSPKVIPYNEFGNMPKARGSKDVRFPTKQMEWKEIDGRMFFRLKNIEARENFEYQYAHNLDFYGELANYYRANDLEMPSDTLKTIQALPSLSETFLDMLHEMKSKAIDTLVVDLRGNGGGWTPIIYPTLYMLYGDRYLDTDMDARFYRRISDLYLRKLNTTIEEFNKGNGLNVKTGDYLMPYETHDNRPIVDRRADFIDRAFCSDSIKALLRATNGEPVYTPGKIFVVTDESTFSAAFHYAFYLSKLGAIVAGETSSQAPNCYMEVTPFRLPYTGLTGSISNAMQVFLPGDDRRARQFTPDITLDYDGYRRYGFDSESILLHLLEID